MLATLRASDDILETAPDGCRRVAELRGDHYALLTFLNESKLWQLAFPWEFDVSRAELSRSEVTRLEGALAEQRSNRDLVEGFVRELLEAEMDEIAREPPSLLGAQAHRNRASASAGALAR
jgi:hypothetical protein